MSNILITGSTGLVGSESVKFFVKKVLMFWVLIIILESFFLVKMETQFGLKEN